MVVVALKGKDKVTGAVKDEVKVVKAEADIRGAKAAVKDVAEIRGGKAVKDEVAIKAVKGVVVIRVASVLHIKVVDRVEVIITLINHVSELQVMAVQLLHKVNN